MDFPIMPPQDKLPDSFVEDMLKKASDGGLEGAVDANGNALISDTALRDNLSFNLRSLTERHKQVCGCEVLHSCKQIP